MSRRADPWLGGGLCTVVAGAALGVLWPGWREYSGQDREFASLRSELHKPAGGPEVLTQLSRDLQTLREFGEGRTRPIPDDSDMAGLIRSLSSTLETQGLLKRDITTRAPKPVLDVMSLPITVALTGGFPSVYEAIIAVEAMERLVRVERVRMSAVSEGGGEVQRGGAVRAELMIDVFYNPPRAAGDEDGADHAGEGP